MKHLFKFDYLITSITVLNLSSTLYLWFRADYEMVVFIVWSYFVGYWLGKMFKSHNLKKSGFYEKCIKVRNKRIKKK